MVALTRNQRLVLGALRGQEKPMTAYALLDALRPQGLRAPPTIYRALDALVAAGLVHRLESLNAFLACGHPDSDHGGPFLICDRCGLVTELPAAEVDDSLQRLAKAAGFQADRMAIELHGQCAQCSAKTAP